MSPRSRVPSPSSPSPRAAFVAVSLALAAATAEPAAAERPAALQDGIWNELSLAASVASREGATPDEESAQAVGVQARFGGSLYAVMRPRPPGPGFRLRDAWTVGLGTGLQRGYTSSSLGFAFRFEAALRPVYQVSDRLDLFARVGYMVGYDRLRGHPGCFSGNDCVGYDAWILTAGARAGDVYAEAGLGWAAKSQVGGYRMATVQYRLRPAARLAFVGLHYEGTGAAEVGDVAVHTLRLVVGSH
jgi:hypothetical protein